MRLIMLGPSGAGQGTQAERLAAGRGIPHVSTESLPDEVTDQLVADRLAEPDAASGFLLEGYPRTMPQARALEALLQGWGTPLDAVLQLVVDEDDERADVDDRETAPLAEHYAAQGLLVRVDGGGATEEVADRLAAALEESVPARAADRATPGASSGSRPPLRALRILFAALVCWPLVGLPLKVAVGEPYPSLFAPSFAIPVGADGKVPYSAYRLTAIRADGSALPVDVKRIFPNSRAAIGIVARRILQEDAAVQSPESKEWLRERLRVEYRLEDPRALVVHWLEREWDARTKSTSPADHVRPTRIDLDEAR